LLFFVISPTQRAYPNVPKGLNHPRHSICPEKIEVNEMEVYPMSPVDSIQTKPPADSHRNRQPWYAMVWRWHLYAVIVFAPLIIFLAITGGIYMSLLQNGFLVQ